MDPLKVCFVPLSKPSATRLSLMTQTGHRRSLSNGRRGVAVAPPADAFPSVPQEALRFGQFGSRRVALVAQRDQLLVGTRRFSAIAGLLSGPGLA
jgi:hypothetical protein